MKIEPRKPQTPFDFTDAVTQPFRTDEGRHFVIRLVLWMTGLMVVLSLITMPFLLPHYGALLEFSWLDMQATLNNGPKPDPAIALDLLFKLGPIYLVSMLGMWSILIAGEAALHRKLLQGAELSRRPLRFGKDELRVFCVQLGVWIIWFAAYVLGVFIIALSAGLLGMVSPVLAAIVAIIVGFLLLVVLVFAPIRLAPAAAVTIDRNKRHLLAARHVTKHRFWNLFLAYLVVGLLGYIGIYCVSAVCLMVVTGDPQFIFSLSGLGPENPRLALDAAGERLKNPIFLVLGVISLIVYIAVFCTWILCLAGIGTYAVKWWKKDDPTPNFD